MNYIYYIIIERNVNWKLYIVITNTKIGGNVMYKETFRAIPEKEKLDLIRENENLGIVVQIAMVSRNLETKTFAEKVKVTPATISNVINNTRKPSARLLRDMLKCLGLTANQFLEIINYYNNYQGEWKYTYTLYETVKRVVENLESTT